MNSTAQDTTLALGPGLAALAFPEITDARALRARGGQLAVALVALKAGGDDFTPDNHLNFVGGWFVNFGFAEERTGARFKEYRLTNAGKVFAGEARGGWRLPGWVSLTRGTARDEIHFDLRNAEHVTLMRRMLQAGYMLVTAVRS